MFADNYTAGKGYHDIEDGYDPSQPDHFHFDAQVDAHASYHAAALSFEDVPEPDASAGGSALGSAQLSSDMASYGQHSHSGGRSMGTSGSIARAPNKFGRGGRAAAARGFVQSSGGRGSSPRGGSGGVPSSGGPLLGRGGRGGVLSRASSEKLPVSITRFFPFPPHPTMVAHHLLHLPHYLSL